MTESQRNLISASEVARRAHVHHTTVLKWAREGLIPAIQLPGGTYRFDEDQVKDWLTPRKLTESDEAVGQ